VVLPGIFWSRSRVHVVQSPLLTQALLLLKCNDINENGCWLFMIVSSYCSVVKEVLAVHVLSFVFVLRGSL
jgi:hypothetical protein